jgi:hypothetical protein
VCEFTHCNNNKVLYNTTQSIQLASRLSMSDSPEQKSNKVILQDLGVIDSNGNVTKGMKFPKEITDLINRTVSLQNQDAAYLKSVYSPKGIPPSSDQSPQGQA